MSLFTFFAPALLFCAAAFCAAPAQAAPVDSLYRLAVPLTDSQGRQFDWSALAGLPTLVTMFYGDCNAACPIILESLQRTVAALKGKGGKLQVLLVSLDTMGDTPASLARLAALHKLDPAIFRLAVSSDETHTRAMAAALQVKYRAVVGGEINHTTRVCLLDANGRIIASSTQLSVEPDVTFLAQIRHALE